MSVTPQVWWLESELDVARWREIVDPVLDRVLTARDRGRFPQSLLLVGPKGLGRELAAVRIAAMLTCPENGGQWCECSSCRRVVRGVHPDVTGVFRRLNVNKTGLKKHICVDWARDIVEMAPGKPYEAKKRIWIFSGAEPQDLGNEAANALLKVLEEPPSHVVFILLAANPVAVLSTIRSRCQQLITPGVVAVARKLEIDADVPELAASPVEAAELNEATGEIRKALTFGLSGETGPLVRLPYRLPAGLPPFAAVASVALQMACETEEPAHGEDLARLAADLLATERRTGALNLNVKGQLVSGLMRWYRELQ